MKRSNMKVNARSKSIRWNILRLYAVIILVGAIGITIPASSQTAVTRSVIASGGGIAAGGGMILIGTIGQGTIGPVTNGGTTILIY